MLNFPKLEFLTADTARRANTRHHAKFRIVKQLRRYGSLSIFVIGRPSAILEF